MNLEGEHARFERPGRDGRAPARPSLAGRCCSSRYTAPAVHPARFEDCGAELLEKPFTPDGLAPAVRPELDSRSADMLVSTN